MVEILTAVSIMSILAGLLLPIVASAKESSKRTSCASNLGQIHAALLIYAADSDERFARGKDCGDLADPQLFASSVQIEKVPMIQKVLEPYVHFPMLFKCPDDNGMWVLESEFPLAEPLLPTDYVSCGNSYEYRTELGLSASSTTSFTDLTKVNVMADLAGHWHGASAAALPTDNMDDFQDKAYFYRYELLFLDGHVALATNTQMEAAWKSH